MTITDGLERLARAATPGPYTAEVVEQCEPAAPDIWRVHGGDDSYEATICECWTGEQDNEAQNSCEKSAALHHSPKAIGHVIHTSFRPRMATQNAPQRQPTAAGNAVKNHCVYGVLRTAGLETTGRR